MARYLELSKIIAEAEAARIKALGEFAANRRLPSGEPTRFGEYAPEELAVEARLAPATAAREMRFAQAVLARLPRSLAALAAGDIDMARLQSMERATSHLTEAQAAQVEQRVLDKGGRPSHQAFTAATRRAVLAVDPDGAQQRADLRKADRHVRLVPDDDGMARLQLLVPAVQAQCVYQLLTRLGRQALAADPADTRSLDQARADVAIDLLLGRDRDFPPIQVEVQVVVPVTTLLGMSDAPGELPGYGPLPAGIARQLADQPNSTWRRILTDPLSGALVEVGDRRFPSPAQVRHVKARDRRCIFPGCGRPAAHCDVDHTLDYAIGGRTLRTNMGSLCRRHHMLKHSAAGWSLKQTGDGKFTWRTPGGRKHTVTPPPYADLGAPPG